MSKRLENKVAIVTGASNGVGADTARLFVEQGARVVLCARRRAVELNTGAANWEEYDEH